MTGLEVVYMPVRLTQKENLLRVIRGETPQYVPMGTFGLNKPPLYTMADPLVMGGFRGPQIGRASCRERV
jgi:hypothetical protein